MAKTMDEALADVRKAVTALADAYELHELRNVDEAAAEAAWFARKVAEVWQKERARGER